MEDFRLEGIQQNSSLCFNAMNNHIMNSDNTNKFTIPALKPKTSGGGLKLIDGGPGSLGGSSSNINQFLLKQLEQQGNNGQVTSSRFNVPKLEKGGLTSNFIIPEFKTGKSCKVSLTNNSITTNLHQEIQGLKTRENEKRETSVPPADDNIIDLTTALSSTRIGNSNNVIGANQRKKTQSETFEIPFIDCDRQEQLPQTDNYCLIDISHIQFHHKLAQPSTLGRILACKPRRARLPELPAQKTEFKAKHRIDRFSFDTKSPDDIVLASLNRFTRVQ